MANKVAMKMTRWAIALVAITAVVTAQTSPTPRQIAALVYPNDLKADVSFLASDALEGRATPSRGLEIAAEYIAAQYRRAGLEPGGSDGYFQTVAHNEATSRATGPVKLRNVIGVLRGSDPVLKDECVVVSAHYDHTGVIPDAQGDNIFNGANDDASGTAGVIAIAKALSALSARPKRSLVFLAVFGEERGALGSRHYVRHPLFPMEKTIANINLEQIGRTDSRQGPRLLQFNLTGHDYTTMAAVFEQAGRETGVRLVKDAANTEVYFEGSDNVSFADAGVPSTTVSVTYQFPDYHKVGDEWSKLDYENMAKVTGTIAAAVFRLADGEEAPRWNAETPRTERYRKARDSGGHSRSEPRP